MLSLHIHKCMSIQPVLALNYTTPIPRTPHQHSIMSRTIPRPALLTTQYVSYYTTPIPHTPHQHSIMSRTIPHLFPTLLTNTVCIVLYHTYSPHSSPTQYHVSYYTTPIPHTPHQHSIMSCTIPHLFPTLLTNTVSCLVLYHTYSPHSSPHSMYRTIPHLFPTLLTNTVSCLVLYHTYSPHSSPHSMYRTIPHLFPTLLTNTVSCLVLYHTYSPHSSPTQYHVLYYTTPIPHTPHQHSIMSRTIPHLFPTLLTTQYVSYYTTPIPHTPHQHSIMSCTIPHLFPTLLTTQYVSYYTTPIPHTPHQHSIMSRTIPHLFPTLLTTQYVSYYTTPIPCTPHQHSMSPILQVYHAYFQPLEWTVPHREDNACYGKLVVNKADNVSL